MKSNPYLSPERPIVAEIKTIEVTDYPDQYADTDYTLIDVREADEYAAGHIPGTTNLPLSELEARHSEIPTDKPVLLVCQKGGRSMMAAQFLQTTGNYDDIVNLDGGTGDWQSAGNEIET